VVGEEHQTVAQALSRLAQRHKEVLLLREVEGLSYGDIGQRLNVSHSAVETLLFRARRRLREEYRQAQRSSMGGLTLVQ
jgi:RNA polymerase sigma factor (sigma-70 family)